MHFSEQRIGLQIPVSQQGPTRADAMPTSALLRAVRPKERAELQGRFSLPLMALVLGLLAIPLSRLRPRQGRYARAGMIVLIYFVYTNVITAGETWIANGRTPAWLGLWWVHAAIGTAALLVYVTPRWWRRRRSRVAALRVAHA